MLKAKDWEMGPGWRWQRHDTIWNDLTQDKTDVLDVSKEPQEDDKYPNAIICVNIRREGLRSF